MNVRILKRAEKDLSAIHRYVSRDSVRNATAVVDALLVAIEGLGDFPESGPVPRDERLRRLGFRFVASSSYLIFYKIVRRQIRVYRVLHGKRSYEQLL